MEAAPPLLGKVTDKNCLGHSYLEEVKQNNEEINLINHPEKSSWPAAVDITVKVENPVSQGSKTSSAVDSGGWAGKKLDWRVVTTAGDGRTFDIWYPYESEGIIADRALALQDPDPVLKQAHHLAACDGIERTIKITSSFHLRFPFSTMPVAVSNWLTMRRDGAGDLPVARTFWKQWTSWRELWIFLAAKRVPARPRSMLMGGTS